MINYKAVHANSLFFLILILKFSLKYKTKSNKTWFSVGIKIKSLKISKALRARFNKRKKTKILIIVKSELAVA
jgi:hypothetical protein